MDWLKLLYYIFRTEEFVLPSVKKHILNLYSKRENIYLEIRDDIIQRDNYEFQIWSYAKLMKAKNNNN